MQDRIEQLENDHRNMMQLIRELDHQVRALQMRLAKQANATTMLLARQRLQDDQASLFEGGV